MAVEQQLFAGQYFQQVLKVIFFFGWSKTAAG